MPRARRAFALLAIALVAGCGGDDDATETGARLPAAGGGGTLTYAVPAVPGDLDPLAARGRTALIATRQVHEPLIARLSGPYGDTARRPGLATSAVPSERGSVWTLTLRPGVRFQDGARFNAAAVQVNARRWIARSAGRRLLPELFAVDAPRPDQVRFLLDAPVPDLDTRLSSPRLAVVSPQALERQDGEPTRIAAGATGSGTGAFELTGSGEQRLELSRYAAWWGSPLGLGPALDGVTFLAVPVAADRLRLLEQGSAQVADPLDPAALAAADADPLLVGVGDGRGGIGLAGSVRGIDSARAVPILSRAWLTDLAG